MALKDMLAEPPAREYPDKVSRWRDSLDETTRDAFDRAVRDPLWTSVALAKMLTDSGFKVGDKTIRTYRERLA